MRTRQAQGILDKAPEGATHYMKKEGFTSQYGFDKGERSNIFDTRDRNECVFSDKWEAISLDGLRKKHGKTVVDAVNFFQADIYPVTDGAIYKASKVGYFPSNINEPNHALICTIEEFNQCIDDLSKFANRLIAIPCKEMDYTRHHLIDTTRRGTKMVLLTQKYYDEEKILAIRAKDVVSINVANDTIWLKYFEPEKKEVRSASIVNTPADVQLKIYVANYGKQPSAKELKIMQELNEQENTK